MGRFGGNVCTPVVYYSTVCALCTPQLIHEIFMLYGGRVSTFCGYFCIYGIMYNNTLTRKKSV